MFQRVNHLQNASSIIVSAPYNDGRYQLYNFQRSPFFGCMRFLILCVFTISHAKQRL
jgi:hypothetical protein